MQTRGRPGPPRRPAIRARLLAGEQAYFVLPRDKLFQKTAPASLTCPGAAPRVDAHAMQVGCDQHSELGWGRGKAQSLGTDLALEGHVLHADLVLVTDLIHIFIHSFGVTEELTPGGGAGSSSLG